MIEVAGIWELGWSAPITEVEHWGMPMRSFGVEKLNMTPVSGIDCRWLDEYSTMAEMLKAKSHLTPVFVDENSDVELSDFVHPENALYLFGKAAYSPFTNLCKDQLSVRIDCPKLGMLWPHQALAIVLYDRGSK